jgi:hypothetical protein
VSEINTTEGVEEQDAMDAIANAQGDLGAAPDNVADISKARKPSKHEMRMAQRFQERLQRLMNRGMSQQQALLAIQREDYEALPPEKKIKRLEGIIKSIAERLGQDITNLRYNDNELGDAMDVNFMAFSEMLVKLGISREEQDLFVKTAQATMAARRASELEQQKAAAEAAQKAAAAKNEAASVEEEAKVDDAAGTPHVPEEATTFGG